MSRTIHGLSHKCLKSFRKQSASLPVYWIYVSRMNNEGVAWPSVAGLARDTGWNKNTCLKARDHLVAIGALERVKDYERPEWRELPSQEKANKKNLDHSEYYRPTGYIVLDGKKLPMLYTGSEEQSDIEIVSSDVLNRRTPKPSDAETVGRRNGRKELNSPSESDSIPELNSKANTPAPSGAALPETPDKAADSKPAESPKPPPKAKEPKRLSYPRDMAKWTWDHFEQFAEEHTSVNALADLYIPGFKYTLKRLPNKTVAKHCVELFQDLQRNEITVERYESLRKAGAARQSSDWYKDKPIDIFKHMNDVLPNWLKSTAAQPLQQSIAAEDKYAGLIPVQDLTVPPRKEGAA